MKRLLALLALFGISGLALAQATNPQPDYVSAMQQAQPSVWLNFNGSSATSFPDQISGLDFTTQVTTGNLAQDALSGNGQVLVSGAPMYAGALSSVTVSFNSAPTAGSPLTIVIATNNTGGSLTITDSFSVTLSASLTQTFVAGSDYSPRNVQGGQLLGWWTPSSSTVPVAKQGSDSVYGGYYLTAASSLPSGPQGYGVCALGTQCGFPIEATVTSATITPRQPGFDLRWPNNTSAEFPYNGWTAAPNDSLGDLEWNTPWSIRMVVPKIDFDKLTNTPLVLTSKGDIDSKTGAFWELELSDSTAAGQDFPLATQACWILNAPTPGVGGSEIVNFNLCSNTSYDLINKNAGPYDFVLTNDGGGWTSDFQMYVNGMSGGGPVATQFTALGNLGFDPAVLHVTGGTGYAATTAYTSSNGCVSGFMLSTGGVPDGFSYSYNANCKTVPTITLTSPTGTGAVITADIYTSSMSTAASYPLMIGSPYGFSTDTNQAATYVDEFAEFNTALTAQQIQNMWTTIPWYQTILGAPPAVPIPVLLDNDGGDPDNEFSVAEYIGLAQKGYLKPLGLVQEDTAGSCQAVWRQMLDQGGLRSVPVGTTYSYAAGGTGCYPSNLATYNASTPTASGGIYETDVEVYRKALAAYPSSPVDIMLGADWTSLENFMESSADSISPLTGLQLLAQDAANGGVIYAQGIYNLCTPTSPPAASPCSGTYTGADSGWDWAAQAYVIANNGSMPIYILPNTPQSTGPGIYESRTAKDPMYLFLTTVGNDSRQGWDPMTLAQVVTGKFRNGLQIGYSGGTGYANYTPLSSTGGGTDAEMEGWLTASSGVPNGIVYPGGGTAYEQYQGIGDGFTSLPTLSAIGTGSGVTLTPYLNTVCGTMTVTNSGTNFTQSFSSATCSNLYFAPFSWKAVAIGSVVEPVQLQWFVNSLINAPPPGRPRP